MDESCIDCDLCREIAPATMKRNEETGFSYVYRQPETEAEMTMAEEAWKSCPTESIGADGEGG